MTDHCRPGTATMPWAGYRVGYRDCHLWPDLLLIYAKPSADVLRLVRLGSHTDLFD